MSVKIMDYFEIYANFLKKFLKIKKSLTVVFDCSNGTASMVLKKLFANTDNVVAILINHMVDGNFPGHGPNPLAKGALDRLSAEVKKHAASFGVAFDADGDRAFFVDEKGRAIDASEIAYILMHIIQPPFVASVNSGALAKQEKALISRVGHFFIKKIMREKNINFGAEPSGHYYFKEFFYCDSAIVAAIKIMNFVSWLNTPISAYIGKLPKYFRSGEINFEVGDKMSTMEKIEDFYAPRAIKTLKVDGLSFEFKDFWFNVRPSNTENLVRLNMEARNENTLQGKLEQFKNLLNV